MIRLPTIFFFNDTATPERSTLSLPDALPISGAAGPPRAGRRRHAARAARAHRALLRLRGAAPARGAPRRPAAARSEEHTSELQSRQYLVCRLLLEKKNKIRSYS